MENKFKLGDIVVINEKRIGMVKQITKDIIYFVMTAEPRGEYGMIDFEPYDYYLIDNPTIRSFGSPYNLFLTLSRNDELHI